MINWWKQRGIFKQAQQLVDGTRKLLRVNRDILDPKDEKTVAAVADSLSDAIRAKNVATIDTLGEKLESQLERVFPRQPFAGLRENVEVFLVAAIVAMAVRTFFVQPFKIPTGSMQPTLYGVFPGRMPESQEIAL